MQRKPCQRSPSGAAFFYAPQRSRHLRKAPFPRAAHAQGNLGAPPVFAWVPRGDPMRNISIDELDRAIFILRLRVSEQKKIIAETDAGPFASAARLRLENLCDNVRRMIAFRDTLLLDEPRGLVH